MTGVLSDQRPVLSVSVIVTHGHEVLLTKRGKEPGKGLWSLPGGKVERAETLTSAAAREVQEETGIYIDDLTFAEFVEIIKPDYHFVIAVFTALPAIKKPAIAGDDACEAGWFGKQDIKVLDSKGKMTPGTFDRICRLALNES